MYGSYWWADPWWALSNAVDAWTDSGLKSAGVRRILRAKARLRLSRRCQEGSVSKIVVTIAITRARGLKTEESNTKQLTQLEPLEPK